MIYLWFTSTTISLLVVFLLIHNYVSEHSPAAEVPYSSVFIFALVFIAIILPLITARYLRTKFQIAIIPILLTAPVIFFYFQAINCTGWLCEIEPLSMSLVSLAAIPIYLIFFQLGLWGLGYKKIKDVIPTIISIVSFSVSISLVFLIVLSQFQ